MISADQAIVDGQIESKGENRKRVMRQRQVNDLQQLNLQTDIKRMEQTLEKDIPIG